MKKLLSASAAIALTFTAAQADQFKYYGGHTPCQSHGYGVERDSKALLLQRLSIAPRHHGCSHNGSNILAVQHSALSASTVKLLGRVEYRKGESWLGSSAKYDIENWILRSGIAHNPNSLVVVLGYADKSGPAAANYRLSDLRANLVKNHISHVAWNHGIKLQATTVPMGEEVELYQHGLHHNRVAEIWVINFPRPVQQLISVVEPVNQHQAVETHVVTPQIASAPLNAQTAVFQQAPTQQPVVQQAPIQQSTIETETTVPAPAPSEPAPQPKAPAPVVENVVADNTAAPVANPLQGLVDFLEKNITLSNEADRAEFAEKLNALKTIGVAGNN